MIEQQTLWAAYNDTGGFVDRPASRDRAEREIADGSLSQRQQAILELLALAGKNGMTWKQLGDRLGLHHGKVSGALSNMHKCGVVFMLQQRRDRCHPYVHAMFRDLYEVEQRFDLPARTKGNQRNDLLNELLETCRIAAELGWSAGMTDAVNSIVATINAHEQSQKQS